MLHPKQLAFALDPRRFKVARCSRRAGKTVGAVAMLLDSAMRKPGSVSLYVTKTAKRAKELIWVPLKRLNAKLKLGGVANGSELSLTLPNDSVVRLAGANTRDKVEDRRGDPIGLAILDEAQTLPGYVEELIDSAIAPALADYNGSIALTGTPPPVPAGFFDRMCNNTEWSLHHWTAFDNPYLEAKSGKTIRQLLDEELKRKGVTEDAAVIQREWFGRIAIDSDALVLHYVAALNDYAEQPRVDQFVICIDVGFEDADAVGALGWSEKSPDVYLTHESVLPKQSITQLGNRVRELYDNLGKVGTVNAIVQDMGGLGKKIADELQQRWGLPIEAAEKERKVEHLELLDDAMRTGHMKARATSRFAQDCALMEWDRDKSTPDKRIVSERYHSDAVDMVLYGYRRCLQWLYVAPPDPGPPRGTPEWHDAQARIEKQRVDDYFAKVAEEYEQAERERKEAERW